MTGTSQLPRWFILVTVFVGVAAFGFAIAGLMQADGVALSPSWSEDSLDRFARVLFGAMAVLGFNEPPNTTPAWPLSVARLLAIVFTLALASGILFEIYRPFRKALRRLRFWRQQTDSAVVVGLGWIGHALARELRSNDRPVYAIEPDRDAAEDAERDGILVVEGDATDASTWSRAAVDRAAEAFVATGSDTLNLEIAGEWVEDLSDIPGRKKRALYVHIGDASLMSTLRAKNLFADTPPHVTVRLFCTQELATQQLFLDMLLNRNIGLLPSPDRTARPVQPSPVPLRPDAHFHLFVVGFGALGQAVALHTARFAHLPNNARPRLTIFDPNAADRRAWMSFLNDHPAFAPTDLRLGDLPLRDDAWSSTSHRAATREYQTRDPDLGASDAVAHSTSLAGKRRHVAVEYAVQAEYLPIRDAEAPGRMLDRIVDRIEAGDGDLRSRFVFCLEDEQTNVQAAIDLQQALARRLLHDPPDPTDDISISGAEGDTPPPSPSIGAFHVYLPVEHGLAHALHKQTAEPQNAKTLTDLQPSDPDRARRLLTNRHIPLYAFGQRDAFSAHEAVTRGATKDLAEAIRAVHESLSPHGRELHPDFDRSNLDSILFAEMRFAALGITFHAGEDLGDRHRGDALLYSLSSHALRDDLTRLHNAIETDENDRYVVAAATFREWPAALQERLALLGRVVAPKNRPGEDDRLNDATNEAVKAAIRRFQREMGIGRHTDVAAMMEHNRWMGERLSEGWKFGPRSTIRKQRTTMIPWKPLPESDRLYDRQQQPRLILAQQARDRWAFANPDDACRLPPSH